MAAARWSRLLCCVGGAPQQLTRSSLVGWSVAKWNKSEKRAPLFMVIPSVL